MHGLSLSICLDTEIETAQPRPSWSIVSRSLRRPWMQSLHFLVSSLFFSFEILYSVLSFSHNTRCGFFSLSPRAAFFHPAFYLRADGERVECLLKELIGHNLNQYIHYSCLFCRRNKTGDSYGIQDNHIGSGGGGIGKWLREHLGGGSKGSHDINSTFVSKENANTNGGSNKSLGKTIYTSQNLYCSLPREHGRYIHNSGRKINHGNFTKSHGYDRPRSNSMNHHEKSISGDLGTLTRGGPIYGSEGRSLKKRNRDSRRYSLHETHDQGRHRQKR